MGREEQPITVVGAGPAGGLMSLYLARRGLRVFVYERLPDLRRVAISAGRSINLALANRGLHALSEVGLTAQVEQHLIPMRGRLLHDVAGSLDFQPYGHRPHEVIYSVSRQALTALLLDAVEATGRVEIRFRHNCLGVNLEHRCMTLYDEANDRLHEVAFHRIIGCDGVHSPVRHAVLAATAGRCTEEPLAHGYKELTIPPADDGGFRMEAKALHIWPRGGFMLIALPNLDRGFTVTLFLPCEGDPSFASLTDEAELCAFFEHSFPDAVALMPRLAQEFFSHPTGRLSTLRCTPWHVRGEAVILGDAAHAVVPFHGQGMNCAFEDCSALDACLGRLAGDWERAFSELEALRRPNAEAIADLSIENYLEMRSSVREPRFQMRRELGWRLEERHPRRFIPRYSMVMFHRIPYAEAKRRGQIQEGILDRLTTGIEDLAEVDLALADRLIGECLSELEQSP